MGLYLRKSVRVGPFRFNLSGSGIGVSCGIRGLRIGTGPRGNYIQAGRRGIYSRLQSDCSPSDVFALRLGLGQYQNRQQRSLLQCFNRFSHCFSGNCSAKFSKISIADLSLPFSQRTFLPIIFGSKNVWHLRRAVSVEISMNPIPPQNTVVPVT